MRDYRGVGAPPVSGDNVYFAVVVKNPVAKGYILLAPVVREEPTRKAFIGMAFSCDGVHFSEFLRVLESTPASYGRGTDQPVDGVVVRGPRAPTSIFTETCPACGPRKSIRAGSCGTPCLSRS